MANPFSRSIAGRLRLFSAVVLLPLIVLGGMLLYDYWVIMPDHALSETLEMADEGTHQVDDFINRTGKVLTVLSHVPLIENLQTQEAGPFLQHLNSQFRDYDNFSLISAEGVILASARPEAVGVQVTDRVSNPGSLESDEMFVSDVLISRGLGHSTVVVTYPIIGPQDTSPRGRVGATIDLGALPSSLQRSELPPNYRMTVFDRQGQVVFQAAPEGEAADVSQCTQCHALPSNVVSLGRQTWQGKGQFHSISMTSLGWRVVVTAPSDIVLGAAQRNAWMVLAVVLLVLAVSITAADITGRRLARPILRLAQAARRFGAGEQVLPLPATASNEVGILTQSFNAMTREIGDGRRRQEKQQARLHTLWELDLAISSTLSLPGVLDIVAEEMQRHGSVSGMAVYLLDEDGGLTPVLSRGTARPLVTGRGEARLQQLASEVIGGSAPAMTELKPASVEVAGGASGGENMTCYAVPLASRGKALGAILFCSSGPLVFNEEEREFLYGVGLQASTAVENARLYGSEQRRVTDLEALSQELKRQRDELQRAQDGIMETLNLALQAKDPYTRGHAERVGLLSRRIASRLGLPRERQDTLARAARLHDIGKISIPEHLLSKEGGLTPPERTQFELHPERSAELLRHLPDLDQVLPAIRGHHERWDGKGYPDGIARDEIPLEARIIAVADAYDALTTDRPYRRGLAHAAALDVLRTYAGTQWDPDIVQVLLDSFTLEGGLEESRPVSHGPGESREG